MNGRLEVFPTAAAFQQGAANRIVNVLQEALRGREKASVALAGGGTPGSIYRLLGSERYRDKIAWENVHFFWGDERCVPPDMPESNFRMAKESLLERIAVPPENVHRVRGEWEVKEAARDYEEEIRAFFSLRGEELPEFTLMLLGLGEDGHTASLFPGSEALHERRRIVAEVFGGTPSLFRVTLTLPVINRSGTVLALVAGESKASILREVLEGAELRYPAQYVKPASGRLFWLTDAGAASHIRKVKTT